MDVQVNLSSDPNVTEGIMGSTTHLDDGNGTVLASYSPSIPGLQWLHVFIDGEFINRWHNILMCGLLQRCEYGSFVLENCYYSPFSLI